MFRVMLTAIVLFILSSAILTTFIESSEIALLSIAVIGIALVIFTYTIYFSINHVEKELITINKYLKNIEKIDKLDYKVKCFTQEFEEINQNILKILKNAKEREDIKQKYNAKLKLKNRQRADMISALAHEFRNPIASIVGYAQTLEEDKSIPKNLQDRFLNKIYNNGNKIESLLSRLVLWNKFESKEATINPITFDIFQLIQDVKVSLEEKYPDREIEIKGFEYKIKADITLIEIVLKNLIENAIKYSTNNVIIEIRDKQIFIIDRGLGVANDDISKITKKFYRSGTHSWNNSMGLGLSIVKNILLLHKSKLNIKSREKKGSTFSFKI